MVEVKVEVEQHHLQEQSVGTGVFGADACQELGSFQILSSSSFQQHNLDASRLPQSFPHQSNSNSINY
jgi:hypothetical protein